MLMGQISVSTSVHSSLPRKMLGYITRPAFSLILVSNFLAYKINSYVSALYT